MSFAHERSILGHCSCCGSQIPTEQLLVSYEPDEGWPRMLAACGACEEIVLPV